MMRACTFKAVPSLGGLISKFAYMSSELNMLANPRRGRETFFGFLVKSTNLAHLRVAIIVGLVTILVPSATTETASSRTTAFADIISIEKPKFLKTLEYKPHDRTHPV